MTEGKIQKLSLTQCLLFAWIIFSALKASFESLLLNPRDIWLNSPFYAFDFLFAPLSFLLYNIYALFFSFLPVGYNRYNGWSFAPSLNIFGTILVSFAILLTFLIPAFFIGRYINTKSWKKYIVILVSIVIIFDFLSFSFAFAKGVRNAPSLRTNNTAIGECNKEPVGAVNCYEDCKKSIPGLPFPSERTEKMVDDYNKAWLNCTSKCDKLRIELKNECLERTGLPEYQNN